MTGVFVTGTDTGIGKTMVSAWITRSWNADYWKPIQSGTIEGLDADVVRRFAPNAKIFPSAYSLKAPLSPHEAARLEGVSISLDAFHLPKTTRPLVVEGAGGALAPINDHGTLMVDLMAALGLPAVVVARSGLGTINHSLLTLEALRRRDIVIAGVILSGEPNAENRAAIEKLSGVKVVAELPRLPNAEALIDYPPLEWTL